MNYAIKIKTSILFYLFFILSTMLSGCRSDSGSFDGRHGGRILSWATPTIYSDGTPLEPADIKEYRLYYRTEAGSYSPGAYVPVSAPNTNVDLTGLNIPSGAYYVVVTTVNTTDIESDFSDEVALN
jgi:hypothetical protein